jgi:hypothetical protein
LGRVFTKGQKDLTDSHQDREETELGAVRGVTSPTQGLSHHEARVSLGNGEDFEMGSQSSRAHIIRQTTYRVSSETSV